jgi:hypothetical protein
MIALAWQDLNPSAGGSITYRTLGTAPNQRLIVSYVNVPHYSTTTTESFQVLLYEGSNIIDINTTSMTPIGNTVQGIENTTGSAALTVPGRNSTLWSASNDSWRFFPGNNHYTYLWTPAIGLSSDTISNPIASPATSTSYTVTVTDTAGCTGTASLSITITNPSIIISASPDSICNGNTAQLHANVFANNTYNYIALPITYAPIAGSGTPVLLGDDQVSSMLPIGFNFSFYTYYYNQFNISSNGFITFDTAAYAHNYQGCCSGQMLPNAANPNNLIAAAWEDYAPNANSISYFTTGVFPSRKCVINFTNLPHAPSRDSITTQIILCETSNIIEIHTTTMPGNPHGFWFAHTMGIENSTGTAAVTVSGRNANNTWTATNDAWRFAPFAPYSYLWSPSSTLSNDTINNPVASPASTTTYTLTATDAFGCYGTDSITIYLSAPPAAPIISTSGDTLFSNYPTGNQWYLNGVAIPGAVNATFVMTQPGNYTVVYTNGYGCSSQSSFLNDIHESENVPANNVTIYPNPAKDIAVINYNFASAENTLYIYSVDGSFIMSKQLSSRKGNETINTATLADGVYCWQAGTQQGKLVIIH